jgi:hypothetical protein
LLNESLKKDEIEWQRAALGRVEYTKKGVGCQAKKASKKGQRIWANPLTRREAAQSEVSMNPGDYFLLSVHPLLAPFAGITGHDECTRTEHRGNEKSYKKAQVRA